MRILHPNVGKENVMILKSHLYVYVTDYKARFFLKEIKVSPAQFVWCWVNFQAGKTIDLTEKNGNNFSFEQAINRAINDAYNTVYEFENYDELVREWDNIKYIDNITTFYQSDKE
jgi:hypothetical protein